MSNKKSNQAIDVLMVELNRLGGVVFAHWLLRKNPETAKTVESVEFLDQMFSGKIAEENNWLEPYLEPMYQVAEAINILHDKKLTGKETKV